MTDEKTTDSAASALSAGLAVQVDPLHVSVRGSEGITFMEGWSTGNMAEPGVQIDTVWYAESRRAFGGCIDRAEATQIRDWLNLCIAKWEQEKVTANALGEGRERGILREASSGEAATSTDGLDGETTERT